MFFLALAVYQASVSSQYLVRFPHIAKPSLKLNFLVVCFSDYTCFGVGLSFELVLGSGLGCESNCLTSSMNRANYSDIFALLSTVVV